MRFLEEYRSTEADDALRDDTNLCSWSEYCEDAALAKNKDFLKGSPYLFFLDIPRAADVSGAGAGSDGARAGLGSGVPSVERE